MLREYTNPTFDPSRNPTYQSMVDLIPTMTEDSSGGMSGILDIIALAGGTGGLIQFVEVSWNSQTMTKQTGLRMLLQMKAIAYIAGTKATQGAHALHSTVLPKNLVAPEEAFASPSEPSLGTYDLKLYSNNEESGEQDTDMSVKLLSGFGFQDTPDEWDFMRRTTKFARYSAILHTTDVANPTFAPQYQVAPKIPKKKGQAAIEISLPEWEYMEYEKPECEAKTEWPPEDALPVVAPSYQLLEGTVESYDDKNGCGLIETDSVEEPVLFFRSGVPILSRPTKKSAAGLRGKRVAFTSYKCEDAYYANGLRFLDAD
jgi:hypothetical protein